MTIEDIPVRSAQIIPFPTARARKTAIDQRDDSPATDRAVRIAVGGAWYHDAAIQDSKRAGER